eukprot:57962-Chlamydomonas_euryale.AAC.1
MVTGCRRVAVVPVLLLFADRKAHALQQVDLTLLLSCQTQFKHVAVVLQQLLQRGTDAGSGGAQRHQPRLQAAKQIERLVAHRARQAVDRRQKAKLELGATGRGNGVAGGEGRAIDRRPSPVKGGGGFVTRPNSMLIHQA